MPFEIPESWCWVNGYTCFCPMESIKPSGKSFKYIDIDAIDNLNHKVKTPKIVSVNNAPSRASRKLHSGDVVFSMVRPYLGNIA
ncbi:MAG: restriction endonuclease subunit S, partial [Lachnospiraceae bacterium]